MEGEACGGVSSWTVQVFPVRGLDFEPYHSVICLYSLQLLLCLRPPLPPFYVTNQEVECTDRLQSPEA